MPVALFIVGGAENKAPLLMLLTVYVGFWSASLAAPGLNAAQPVTVCAPLSSLTEAGLVAVKLGWSLTGLTVTSNDLVTVPLSASVTVTLMLAVPLALAMGVYWRVAVPLLLLVIVGEPIKVVLLEVAVIVRALTGVSTSLMPVRLIACVASSSLIAVGLAMVSRVGGVDANV